MKTKYNYTTQYIPTEFWDILDTDDRIKLRLLKDVTGCGATYGIMLKAMRQKRFIVMPTIKLIDDKQRQANNNEFGDTGFVKTISLHGDSDYTKDNIIDADIILMTPDQLVAIYENDKDLYRVINHNLLVIDEEHTFEGAGSYREAFGKLDYIISQQWAGSIITITATTPFCVSPFFDDFDIIQLENNTRPINEVQVTKIESVFHSKLNKFIASGEKVVVVTNDIGMFRALRKRTTNIATITGQTLNSKLVFEGFVSGTTDSNSQVIIISSSATEGIDFNIDAHVMIMSNYNLPAYTFSIQTMVQALGRPRGNLLESVICVSIPKNDKPLMYKTNIMEDIAYVDKVLDKIEKDDELVHNQKDDKKDRVEGTMVVDHNHVVNSQELCSKIAWTENYNIFHSSDYIEQMNVYARSCNTKFIAIKKMSIAIQSKATKPKFIDILKVALTLQYETLHEEYIHQRLNINGGKSYGNISKNYIVANLMAQFYHQAPDIIKTKIEGNNMTLARATKMLNSVCIMHNFIKGNKKPVSKMELLRAKLIKKDKTVTASTKNISNQSLGKIKQEYGSITKECFTQEQVNVIQLIHYLSVTNKVTKDIVTKIHAEKVQKKRLNKMDAKVLKNRWNDLVSDLMGLSVNHYTDLRQKIYSTRTYSAVTELPISLINEIHPSDILEIDISSANPSFVDMLVGSSLRYTIYELVMNFENCTRDEAKVHYNRLLNSTEAQWHYRSPRTSKQKQLMLWGYTKEQAKEIESLSVYKANMFYEMTKIETQIIHQINTMLKIQPQDDLYTIRRHDSIIIIGDRSNMSKIIKQVQDSVFKDFEIHYTQSWEK